MRLAAAILLWTVAQSASALDYYKLTFSDSGSFPDNVTLIDGDGATLKDGVYRNLGRTSESWFINRVSGDYGRVALSATRHAPAWESVPADNWLILPAIEVKSPEAIVRWEARSLHENIAETYRVCIREKGATDWSDLFVSDGESSWWKGHLASLEPWVGSEVEIAFVATTVNGFMLAVDNILVGVPKASDSMFETELLSRRFTSLDDARVRVRITNLGPDPGWTRINLSRGQTNKGSVKLEPGALATGASIEVEFEPAMLPDNTRFDYTIRGFDGTSYTVIYSGYLYPSDFGRTSMVDRFTGTWCPFCPAMGSTLARLKRIHGDELVVVEAHVNDVMQCTPYRTGYFDSFVYGIPTIAPNHEKLRATGELDDTDDFSSAFAAPTAFGVSARSAVKGKKLTVNAEVRVAETTDNAADRYRVGYLLLGDYHSTTRGTFLQDNATSNYKYDTYYYLSDPILPEMVYYENVVIDATYGVAGVAGSLPATLSPADKYTHSTSFSIPTDSALTGVRCLVMLIDTVTGRVVNCALASDDDGSGIFDVEVDSDPLSADGSEAVYYDLTGRRVDCPSSGLYIRRTASGASKIIL